MLSYRPIYEKIGKVNTITVKVSIFYPQGILFGGNIYLLSGGAKKMTIKILFIGGVWTRPSTLLPVRNPKTLSYRELHSSALLTMRNSGLVEVFDIPGRNGSFIYVMAETGSFAEYITNIMG